MTPEEMQIVNDLYSEGQNPEDIAEELGLDEIEVMDFCSDLLEGLEG